MFLLFLFFLMFLGFEFDFEKWVWRKRGFLSGEGVYWMKMGMRKG
jgi:hypothetical protein